MNDNKLNLKALKAKLGNYAAKLRHYSLPVFAAVVIITYGFLAVRVQSLNNAEPSTQTIDSQVKTAQVLRIDPDVVKQLKSLQDNSVSVQALFDQARSNPFQ